MPRNNKKKTGRKRARSSQSKAPTPGLLGQGLKALRQGDAEAARSLFASVPNDSPEYPEALHMLGILHFQSGEPETAHEMLQQSLILQPDNPAAIGNQASVLASMGRYNDALPLLVRGTKLRPDHAPAWRALGDALAHANRLDEAANAFEKALSLWPQEQNKGAMPLNYAATLNGLGRYHEAVPLLRDFLGQNPANVAAHCNLGHSLAELGEYEEAVKAYGCALRVEPELGQAHLGMAGTLEKASEVDQAIIHARRAVELMPCENTWFRLGRLLQAAGEDDEAEVCYRKALADNPQAYVAMNNLGVLALNSKDWQRAHTWFSRARDCAPRYAEAWCNWANLLEKLGELDKAEQTARKAVSLEKTPSTLMRLAYVLQRMGRIDEAKEFYHRCLEADPEDPKGVALYLAGIGLGATPERAPDAHMRELFDQYAGFFDKHLEEKLEYRGPQVLLQALRPWLESRSLGAGATRGWDIMDLGCGTGLCGLAFSPFARRMDGVDLSRRMLAKARSRNIYTELIESNLESALTSCAQDYDLMLAGDVFVYVGELAGIFEAAYTRLRPGGLFAFSTERIDDATAAPQGFVLGKNNRYLHSGEYLRETAQTAGFRVCSLEEEATRNEAMRPVPGYAVVLEKPL